MSATPESFLDTMDSDVEVANESQASSEVGAGGNTEAQSTSANAAAKVDIGNTAAVVSGSEAKDKVDPSGGAAVEKVVPLRALQEEREAAKELKRQIAELNAQPKLTAEDAELLKELKAQRAAAAAPKDVDFLEDPKKYVDVKVDKALEALKKTDEKLEANNNEINQQKQVAALFTAITAHETTFVAANPDYYQALNHVRDVRANQIRLMNPEITDVQLKQAINQEEMVAAHHLIQKGGDPCKFAYEYAKTLGYKKAEVAKLPDKKAEIDTSAARTMGAGGGDSATDDAIDDDDPNAEFSAVKAAFKGKR